MKKLLSVHAMKSFQTSPPKSKLKPKMAEETKNQLKTLDLSYNNIGNLGVKYVADFLSSDQCQIQNLTLISCKITERGATILFDSIIQ